MLIFGSPWHLPPAWGDIPTWITAIATVGLLIGAIITAIYAIRAFREQSREVGILLEQNDRDIRDRRRDQASRVFVHEERYTYHAVGKPSEKDITAYVHNTSEQPVYDVAFRWHSWGEPYTENRRDEPLMPGAKDHDSARVPLDADPEQFGAFVIFRDRAGVRWRAHPDGRFDEIEPGSDVPSYGAELL